MEEDNEEMCLLCRFWRYFEDGDEKGYCQKNPPRYIPGIEMGQWPSTYQYEWCGSYEFGGWVYSNLYE